MNRHSRLVRNCSAALALALAATLFIDPALLNAQQAPKKKKRKKSHFHLSVDSAAHFLPSRSFGPHTVGGYFFPDRKGATWTILTVQTVLNDSTKVVRRDSVINREVVVDTASYSLQGLPLIKCQDRAYKPHGTDTATTDVFYYVDDSVAMTVFNNSVSHQLNKIFLVSPLEIGNRWHDKYGDSVQTVIAGYADSVITPMGRFDSVLVTLTRMGHADLRKFFARGYGVVKTIFRSPGPSGHGIIIIEATMTECRRPDTRSDE
ncbi:MAG: hypothetical protein JSS75_09905 [Bacteroidetes bacterium]|nr:hypothetical protein [Bacteroidota bacterium]